MTDDSQGGEGRRMTDTQELVAELRGWCQCVRANDPCLACNAAARLEALDSLRREALDALEPFEILARALDKPMQFDEGPDVPFADDCAVSCGVVEPPDDSIELSYNITVGDLRRATSLVAKLKGE